MNGYTLGGSRIRLSWGRAHGDKAFRPAPQMYGYGGPAPTMHIPQPGAAMPMQQSAALAHAGQPYSGGSNDAGGLAYATSDVYTSNPKEPLAMTEVNNNYIDAKGHLFESVERNSTFSSLFARS